MEISGEVFGMKCNNVGNLQLTFKGQEKIFLYAEIKQLRQHGNNWQI